jgi:hypothetical protein
MEDLEEVLQDQRDWMREVEEEEQKYREARHNYSRNTRPATGQQ